MGLIADLLHPYGRTDLVNGRMLAMYNCACNIYRGKNRNGL
jgi:hypothetical protein